MTIHNYGILLTFVLCGCATDRRLGGEVVHGAGSGGAGSGGAGSGGAGSDGAGSDGAGSDGTDATDPMEGTTAPTAGAASTGIGTSTGSSARPIAIAGGGNAASTANSTGGTANAGTLDAGTGGRLSSGSGGNGGAPMIASASTRASGGSTVAMLVGGASNGGTSIGGASNGGTSIGSTSNGGTSNGGTSIGGASAGGTGSCVPVCPLYGAPCCMWQTSCLGPTGGCTIDVLTSTVGTTYEYADLEAKVAALPQDVSVSLTEQDFSWVAADPWAAERYELHLTEAAAARYGATLDNLRETTAFRVSCGGKALFVGVVYMIYGAAALHTPVLHHARENGVVVLRLGAVQGGWLFGPSSDCGTPCQRIDRLELRGTFCRLGVMHELAPDARPLNP